MLDLFVNLTNKAVILYVTLKSSIHFKKLLIKLKSDFIFIFQGEFQTKREAAWAISNLTISGNRDQVLLLIQEGVIPPFCALLDCQDNQVIHVVLDGINNMLKMAFPNVEALANTIEECGGMFPFTILIHLPYIYMK